MNNFKWFNSVLSGFLEYANKIRIVFVETTRKFCNNERNIA